MTAARSTYSGDPWTRSLLWVVIGIIVVVAVALVFGMLWWGGALSGSYGGGMMGWGGGAWGLAVLMMIVPIVIVVLLLVLALRPTVTVETPSAAAVGGLSALEAVRLRYARGEISRDEYLRIVQDLSPPR